MGILWQLRVNKWYRKGMTGKTYFDPSDMSRSTVLMGATTMKGMLCRAASTAALYVPIYSATMSRDLWFRTIRQVLTLFAVSPFFAIRSAPTAVRQVSTFLSDRYVLTDGMDSVMLEQGTDHCIANHHRRYFERLKLVGCKSTKS